jgi:hypothetical protein
MVERRCTRPTSVGELKQLSIGRKTAKSMLSSITLPTLTGAVTYAIQLCPRSMTEAERSVARNGLLLHCCNPPEGWTRCGTDRLSHHGWKSCTNPPRPTILCTPLPPLKGSFLAHWRGQTSVDGYQACLHSVSGYSTLKDRDGPMG